MADISELRALIMTTEHLLAGGLTPQGVHRAVVSGDLVRLRPGFYVEGSARALPRGAKHLLNVLAADAALASPVFSHASAALVHGLPEWGLSLSKVAVSSGEQALRTHTTRVMKHHTVSLRGDEVCLVDGLNVTTPERTVADIARTAGRDAGVAVADAALNSGLVTASVLDRALEQSAGRSGIRRARAAMALVDGRSESVAETRSRLTFSDFGLPQPETQANIFDPHGNRVARVDFLWREFGVIGECDGFGKYLDGADATETRRRLGREKDRDAELVALGYRVVHWRWADLENPRLLAERLRRVLYPAAA
jgi:hypothetical protein